MRIARHVGDPDDTPAAWHHVTIVDGIGRCHMPAGTWTLWIDARGFAPLVMRDVRIDGATDLPRAVFSEGSSVRVHILVSEGQAPPRIAVFATHLGRPEYGRIINSGGEEYVTLPGLGPGRFNIRYESVLTEIEVDGAQNFEFDLDLR